VTAIMMAKNRYMQYAKLSPPDERSRKIGFVDTCNMYWVVAKTNELHTAMPGDLQNMIRALCSWMYRLYYSMLLRQGVYHGEIYQWLDK
jgi:hypothetical protein